MASPYANTEEISQIMTELWTRIGQDPAMAGKLLQSKMTCQFNYKDPLCRITVDCSNGKELKVYSGDCGIKPLVEMAMKAEVAHEFWLGKVSIPMAILSGKIVSKGPVQQALSLLPVIKPAYDIYEQIYAQHASKALAAK